MRNSWRWVLVIKTLVNKEWLEQCLHYDNLFVGFSGGLDSTVLLHNLAAQPQLIRKLRAIHINHGLSSNALAWQNHCQNFCAQWQIPFLVQQVEFSREANIEAGARQARYKAFASILGANDCLILGHHLDDQAETLVLQLFRGAGIDGLAAIAPHKQFARGVLLRPLLHCSRQSLEDYASEHQLQWIEDESNQDLTFSRNYLRHQLIPLMRKRWPGVVNNLVRTTRHCQEAQANLDDLAKVDCPALEGQPTSLAIPPLLLLKPARIKNVLRFWFKQHQLSLPSAATFNRLITEVIPAASDANPQLSWQEASIRRYQQTLYLLKDMQEVPSQTLTWQNFPEPLYLEGLGYLQAQKASRGIVIPVQAKIEIGFRRGGELFNWHGQTKQLKKLFQDWQVPTWLRDRIPLLYLDKQLAAVIGYALSDHYYQEEVPSTYQLYLKDHK